MDESPSSEGSLTLVGTLPQDPKLADFVGPDFSEFDSSGLIVSSSLASERGLQAGSPVKLWVTRDLDADGKERETSPALLQVFEIIEGGDKKTAFAHLDLMAQIAAYKAGRPVPERGWTGFATAAAPRYAAYLLFAKRPVSNREERILASRGLVVEPVAADDPRARLHGRLKSADELRAEGRPEILVYSVLSGRQEKKFRWLDSSIAHAQSLLIDCDGILLPWNKPLPAKLADEEVLLVGFSATPRWLRGYLRERKGVFPLPTANWLRKRSDWWDGHWVFPRTGYSQAETRPRRRQKWLKARRFFIWPLRGSFCSSWFENLRRAGTGSERVFPTGWRTPLLRSGLALAGFHHWPRAADANDGVLTALEVMSLDLWGTEIATLSACQTGVGEVRRGLGVFGLRRALVLAGARTQVMLRPPSEHIIPEREARCRYGSGSRSGSPSRAENAYVAKPNPTPIPKRS